MNRSLLQLNDINPVDSIEAICVHYTLFNFLPFKLC